jgi:selenide,water dikinase
MLGKGNISAVINSSDIPMIKGAPDYIKQEMTTGGGERNKTMIENKILYNMKDEFFIDLLSDPQTSGGLLVAIDKEDANKALAELQKNNHTRFSKIIGSIVKKEEKAIIVN